MPTLGEKTITFMKNEYLFNLQRTKSFTNRVNKKDTPLTEYNWLKQIRVIHKTEYWSIKFKVQLCYLFY